MIIEKPLSLAQKEQVSSVSDKAIREAQDALFMYLLNRVAELEEQIAPQVKSGSKMQVYNRT